MPILNLRSVALRRFAVLAFAGCLALGTLGFARPAEAAYGRVSLTVGGVKRTATLVEFERLKKRRRPVIFVLHGGAGGSGAGLRARRSLGLDVFARNTGAIVVYPDAVDGYWGRAKPGQPVPDDAGFVSALANKLVDEGVASRRRIYIAGISGGGMLAMKIACENADLFAGVGAFIANLPAEWGASCNPTKPLAFMLINGTADPLVPYVGGLANMPEGPREVLSADATVAIFTKANGCGAHRAAPLSDRDRGDGSKIMVEHWTGCKAPVELVRVDGGGHTIPGRRSSSTRGTAVGAQNNDVDGARLMWDFLLKRAGG